MTITTQSVVRDDSLNGFSYSVNYRYSDAPFRCIIAELRSADRGWTVSRERTQMGSVPVRRLGFPLNEVENISTVIRQPSAR